MNQMIFRIAKSKASNCCPPKTRLWPVALILFLSVAASPALTQEHATEKAQKFQNLLAKAQQGDAEATLAVGMALKNGEGIGKDLSKAREWFRKTAEKGHFASQHELGMSYDPETIVQSEVDEAVKWNLEAFNNPVRHGEASKNDNWANLVRLARRNDLEKPKSIDLEKLGEMLMPVLEVDFFNKPWSQISDRVSIVRRLATEGFQLKADRLIAQLEKYTASAEVAPADQIFTCIQLMQLATDGFSDRYEHWKSQAEQKLQTSANIALDGRLDKEAVSNISEQAIALAEEYQDRGETNKEEAVLKQWLAICKKLKVSEFRTNKLNERLTNFLSREGEVANILSQLEQQYREAKKGWSKLESHKLLVCGEDAAAFALAYLRLGKPKRAVKIFEEAFSENNIDITAPESFSKLARQGETCPAAIQFAALQLKAGNLGKAKQFHQAIQNAADEGAGSLSSHAIFGLAVTLDEMGDSEEALELFRKAAKSKRKPFYSFPGSFRYARLLHQQGETAAAEKVIRKRIADHDGISKGCWEQNSEGSYYGYWLRMTYETFEQPESRLTDFLVGSDQTEEAIKYQAKLFRDATTYARKRLAYLPPNRRDEYLQKEFRLTLSRSLSLGYHNRTNPRMATVSAGWLLNGKSINEEVQAGSALLSKKELAPTLAQLKSVRSQLAALSLSAKNNQEQTRATLADLETRQASLEQTIADAGLGDKVSQQWKSVGQLMSALPDESRFINIAKIPIYDFQKSFETGKFHWGDERYVAWVIPPLGYGQIECVDLGLAKPIDELVARVRQSLNETPSKLASVGERKLERSLEQTLSKLSDVIYAPLASHVADASELIVSPDSELWSIPWELLRTDNQYLVEQKSIRYLASGRELVRNVKARGGVSRSVVFADPDYDLNAADIRGANNSKLSLRGIGNARFERLSYSASEADSIAPSIENFSGAPPERFLSADAQEATFKNLHRPRVLAISTHGFFRQGSRADPLLRCGLALAGANQRQKAVREGKEDGILTGLEIVGTDLRGTELVVLSACETGLGDITNGEGVAGLRQAFQLAGAQSVISSLWQVEDGETARLMKLFFENLASGKSKSEALRQAQLTRIKARRARHGAAHPFFWAAFTLTGQD